MIGLARTGVQPFADDEIALMATFADQVAIAIANANLFETVERQRGELARFVSPEVAALVSSGEGARSWPGIVRESPSSTSTCAASPRSSRPPSRRS